jgi:hypothetical protein
MSSDSPVKKTRCVAHRETEVEPVAPARFTAVAMASNQTISVAITQSKSGRLFLFGGGSVPHSEFCILECWQVFVGRLEDGHGRLASQAGFIAGR